MLSHVEDIKERLGIIDVVSSYIKIEKAGANMRARCPFHNEKTPSFFISPSRNTYYCFGCGAKGDIFSFVEQFEGTDFKGALKTLAERAGVEITPVNKESEDKKARLYSALDEATSFFEENLEQHKEALLYIESRGITQKSSALWRIGYAPPLWDSLYKELVKKGYTQGELEDAGLIKKSQQGRSYYDRFRGRIMFPVMDSSGRVIAYSGRILPDKKNSEYKEDTAKYINSPETALYEKSHVLYGYHQAKHSIRKFDFSILVEGQMDVVLSHQAGYPNTVAASGTALTLDQLSLLSRLSNNIVMAFDADSAGVTAGRKGIDLALLRGMDVKVAAIPKDSDPADLVQKGGDVWKATVRTAKHVIEFYLDYIDEKYADIRKRRIAVGSMVIPYVASIPNKLDQAHFVSVVAGRLGLKEDSIWDSVRQNAARAPNNAYESSPLINALTMNSNTKQNIIETRLVGILRWQESLDKSVRKIDIVPLRVKLEELLGTEKFSLLGGAVDGKKDDSVIFEAERLYAEHEKMDVEVDDLFYALRREHFKDHYTVALADLKQAESSGDERAITSALEKCREFSEALNQLK